MANVPREAAGKASFVETSAVSGNERSAAGAAETPAGCGALSTSATEKAGRGGQGGARGWSLRREGDLLFLLRGGRPDERGDPADEGPARKQV